MAIRKNRVMAVCHEFIDLCKDLDLSEYEISMALISIRSTFEECPAFDFKEAYARAEVDGKIATDKARKHMEQMMKNPAEAIQEFLRRHTSKPQQENPKSPSANSTPSSDSSAN